MQTTHFETETYHRLISHIYDAVLTPDKWKKFLGELTDTLDCHSVALQFPYKGVQVVQSLCYFLDTPSRLSNHDKELLKALLPHIQRSIDLSRRYKEMEDREKTTIDILEKLPYGIVFLSAKGFPVRHNTRAAQICDKENDLFLDGSGISLKDPQKDKTLQNAISQALDRSTARQGYAIKITTNDDMLHILISPLNDKQGDIYIPGDNVQAIMFISSTKHTPNLSGKALSDMFGLSPAEIRLVTELIRGLSIEETAEHLYVSKHTLRAQLRSIFKKTETRSQSDLIRCLLHSPLILNQKL
ncbi:MAG: helix-turn-helix transcriptional regulator [Gammaproteobacteria bacterium]|nr:helix-turn-helix transcriptional regulator [Gammaproteobacteria bacterium]